MKYGVFYNHVKQAAQEQDISLQEAFVWVKNLGIDYLELNREAVVDDYQKNFALLKNDLANAGLKGGNLCWMYSWEEDPSYFDDFLQIEAAVAIGVDKIMPIPGLYSSSERKAAELERMLENMHVLSEKACSAGLRIGIEDFDNELSAISTIEGMQRFLDADDNLKVVFDTGNFMFSGQDALTALAAFEEKTIHVHLKDRTEKHVNAWSKTGVNGNELYTTAVGYGDAPIKSVIKRLHQLGYDGIFSIELYFVDSFTQGIMDSVRSLQRWEKELEVI